MKVGDAIEDFDYEAYHNGNFVKGKLSDYEGKWVILFFYSRDFTSVCNSEVKGFGYKTAEFEKEGAVVIAASTDSKHSHKAWFEESMSGIKFPVIADSSQSIADYFDILLEDGTALRGTFIISPEGTLKYKVVSDIDVGRSVEETLRVLRALKTEKPCPAEWKPGQSNL